jgi:cytochrome c-type biogenesis protein CcmH
MIWLLFALMLLGGVVVVAWPMLRRERRPSIASGSAVFVVVALTAGMYAQIGSPGVDPAPSGPPDIDAMVAALDARLADNPDDVEGWKMLGRSYMQLQRYDRAVHAFDQALAREGGNNGQTLADLGEAVTLAEGSGVTGRAAELIESAIAAAPNNPKALFYGGIAAFERNDRERAASRWETLLALSPPPEVQEVLRQRIAEWRGEPAPQQQPPARAAPEAGALAIEVGVSLGEPASKVVAGNATVFIIARDPDQPSPPLAAARRSAAELPATVRLSDADAMLPGRPLSAHSRLEIVARVSMSGQPIEQPGDWYGIALVDTSESTRVTITIDRVVD